MPAGVEPGPSPEPGCCQGSDSCLCGAAATGRWSPRTASRVGMRTSWSTLCTKKKKKKKGDYPSRSIQAPGASGNSCRTRRRPDSPSRHGCFGQGPEQSSAQPRPAGESLGSSSRPPAPRHVAPQGAGPPALRPAALRARSPSPAWGGRWEGRGPPAGAGPRVT